LVVVQLDGRVIDRVMAQALTVVDTSPPVITVRGVTDLQVTNQPVTPTITITDQSAFSSTLLLDDAPFVSGTTVSAPGSHVLSVAAVDIFNNRSSLTIRFPIDLTPPAITITGVSEGQASRSATPVITVSDANPPVTVVITLNGQPFASGTPITADGLYTLFVQAMHAAGTRACR